MFFLHFLNLHHLLDCFRLHGYLWLYHDTAYPPYPWISRQNLVLIKYGVLLRIRAITSIRQIVKERQFPQNSTLFFIHAQVPSSAHMLRLIRKAVKNLPSAFRPRSVDPKLDKEPHRSTQSPPHIARMESNPPLRFLFPARPRSLYLFDLAGELFSSSSTYMDESATSFGSNALLIFLLYS